MPEKILIQCPHCHSNIRIPKGKHITFICQKCNTELEYDDRSLYKKIDQSKEKKSISSVVIYLLTLIIAFPVSIILYQFLPVIEGFYKYEKILLFIAIVSILGIVFKKFNNLILIGLAGLLVFLSYGSFQNQYGFSNLLLDYKSLISSMSRSPKPQEVILSNIKSFPNRKEIIESIDYQNSEVRSFALSSIEKSHFDYDKYYEFRNIIQSFAIFKEINKRWNYVSDNRHNEYFAKASETIALGKENSSLQGDCDDYSILIAACIESIGGKTRLIHTNQHIYPELYIGSQKDVQNLDYIISKDLFKDVVGEKDLHYHIDENGEIWLNLDYTADYPGGKFMDEKILGILNL